MTWLDGQWDDVPSPDPGESRGIGGVIPGVTAPLVTWNFNPPPPPQMHVHIMHVERQVGKTRWLQNFLGSLGVPATTESEPEDPAPNSKYRENPPRYSPPDHVFDRRGRKRY